MLSAFVENRSTTLTLLPVNTTILECLTIALITHTEIGLICFNNTAHRHAVHNPHETITDLMYPQESGVLVYSANFGTLTNRDPMQKAGNKLFPYGEVLLRVVENPISRDGESFVAMFADETRTTIRMNTILAHAFTLRATVRTNDTVSQFCINNKLKVRRRSIESDKVNKTLSF